MQPFRFVWVAALLGGCRAGSKHLAPRGRGQASRWLIALAIVVVMLGCSSSGSVADPPDASAPLEAPRFVAVGDRYVSGAIAISRAGVALSGCVFETRSVGGLRVEAAAPALMGEVVAFERGAAREEIAVRGGGVEQRWRFAERPASGAIVVAARGTLLRDGPEGSHWRCDGGAGASYGVATFVDARGARTTIHPVVSDGEIAMTIPDSVLASAAWPAVLDPIVGPEVAADVPSSWAPPTLGLGYKSALATLGGSWIAAWNGNGNSVWTSRVEPDGTLSWPLGVRLVATGAADSRLALASDGATALLAYTTPTGLKGRRISPSGLPLDVADLTLSASNADLPSLAWDGTRFVLAYCWYGACSLTHVSSAGVVDPPIAINDVSTLYLDAPALACKVDGSCLLATMGSPNIYVQRVTGGALLDATPVKISSASARPVVGWNGTSWLVAYGTQAVRVDTSGSTIGSELTLAASGAISGIGCTGGACEVTYEAGPSGSTRINGVRVDASGAILDAPPLLIFAAASGVHTACGAARCLSIAQTTGIFGVRTEGATVLDAVPFAVGVSPNVEDTPAVATDGTSNLVVFADRHGNAASPGVWAMRASATATFAAPFNVATGNMKHPDVAFDGSNWVVVYSSDRPAFRAELVRVGATVSAPIVLADQATLYRAPASPSVACNSVACLATWLDLRDSPLFDIVHEYYSVYGALLPTGSTTPTTLRIAAPPVGVSPFSARETPVVAASPSSFLVVWREPGSVQLVGERFANDGTLLDATPFPLGTAGFVQTNPSVAWADGAFIVAFEETRIGASDIYATRVDLTGKVLDPKGIAVVTDPGVQRTPHVTAARDGHTALITWTDASGSRSAVRGAFVANDGRVLDPTGVGIASDPGADIDLAAGAAATPGKVLLTYVSRIDPAFQRIRARMVESGDLDGSACGGAGTCASRLCFDAHCCDRACDGSCSSCATGTCKAVTGADDADTCTVDKTCDASGVCRSKTGRACATATDCASGACADSFCCATSCSGGCGRCDATPGTCTPKAAGALACGSYVCDGVSLSCPGACTSDGACAPDEYCATGGTCQPRKDLGLKCDATADCASPPCRVCKADRCVDGYCCDAACGAACDSCAYAGSLGRCTIAAKGTVESCAPYTCDGASSSCPSTCTAAIDCAPSSYCVAGACVPRSAIASACKIDDECLGGHCADGVCCDAACAGLCEACQVPGSIGKCTAVVGDPLHAGKICPAADLSEPICSKRKCDGTDRLTCAGVPGGETLCGDPKCEGGVEAPSPRCSAGTCKAGAAHDCKPFACGGAGCATSCTATAGCASGYRCVAGSCIEAGECRDGKVVLPSGSIKDCDPYGCTTDGTCKTSCSDNADCAIGLVCNEARACVPAPPGTPASGGCGYAPQPAREGPLAAMLVLLVAIRARRRRLALAVALLGCSPTASSTEAPDASVTTSVASASATPRRSGVPLVRAPFHPSGLGFASEGRAHRTTIGRDGAIEIEPRVLDDVGPTFVLQTTSLGGVTGARLLFGEAAIDRANVHERVVSTDDGLELSWTFDAPPPGDADLTIRVEVGAELRAELDRVHVSRPGADVGVVIGAATWVDDAGRETRVATIVEASAISWRVPRSVLERTRFPATLDPTVSAEIPVDKAVPVADRGSVGAAAVAFDGAHYLVVSKLDGGLVGQRVAPDGTAIDALPFQITSGPVSVDPRATWDGSTFVVVWDGVGVRVASDGKVLDASPFTIAPPWSFAKIASDGASSLIVWADYDAFTSVATVKGARVVAGVKTSTFTFDSAKGLLSPCVGGGPSGYEVAWSTGSTAQLRGSRVGSAGALLDATPVTLVSTPGAKGLCVASRAAVGWEVAYVDGPSSILSAVRVGADGKAASAPVSVAGSSATDPSLSISYAGASIWVAWDDFGPLRGAWFDSTTGAPLGSALLVDATTIAPSSATVPLLSGDATSTVAVWTKTLDPSHGGTWATPLLPSGTVKPPIPFSTTATPEYAPSVAAGASELLAVFEDRRSGDSDVYGARFTADGSPLDPTAFPIATGAGDQLAPQVAWNGTGFVVVFEDHAVDAGGDVSAIRVSAAGAVDPSRFTIAAGPARQRAPAVACGTTCLALWEQYSASGLFVEIDGVRLSAAGSVLDATPIVVSDAKDSNRFPSVAWNGTDWLTTWQRVPTGAPIVVRVTTAGAVPDPAGVPVASLAYLPRLAEGGGLVVGLKSGSVVAVRLDGSGKVLDPAAIAIGALYGQNYAAAVVGTRGWMVTFVDDLSAPPALRGAFVTSAGVDLDPAPFLIASSPYVAPPAAVSLGSDRVGVAYDRAMGAPLANVRAYVRIVTAGAPEGTSCALKDECASRLCVDGFCCSTPCDAPCRTCGATGSAGTCVAVLGKDDPDTCSASTTCDALGACRKSVGRACAATTDCASTFCAGGVCCSTACPGACDACDATGTCAPAPKGSAGAPACAPFVCGGGDACPSSCVSDADCAPDAYCTKGGVCDARRSIGAACDPVADCAKSGCRECATTCVSGYCCDTPCTGACDTCAGATKGACSQLPAGSETTACGPFRCSGTSACASSCVTDADCASDGYCEAGACKTRKKPGEACTDLHQCATHYCADGVCCDGDCKGTCESCKSGKCIAAAGPASHGSCPIDAATDGSTCGERRCDGIERASCLGYVAGVPATGPCRGATCKDGVASAAAGCDGKGTCAAPDTKTCGAYACDATACRVDCNADGDCAHGNHCIDHACRGLSVCADEVTVVSVDGSRHDCTPFRCVADAAAGAACSSKCAVAADCALGFRCDENGACVPPIPPSAPAASGCAFEGAPRSRATPFVLAAIVALFALRRRRILRSAERR